MVKRTVRKTEQVKLRKLNFSKLVKLFKKLNTNRLLVILLVLAAFLIGVLITKVYYLEKNQVTTPGAAQAPTQGTPPAAPAPGRKVDVSVGHLPPLGKSNAKVTIIEFADFQCPFCEKWFKEVEQSLIKDYVNTNKVKFSFRHFAFLGQESNWAAEASECANEQGKFWEYHDYLFKNQHGENQGAFSKENLKKFAVTLGLNPADFNSCLDSGKYTKTVTDDTAAGQAAGVTGTPTVFINGAPVVGAQSFSAFQAVIEQELKK